MTQPWVGSFTHCCDSLQQARLANPFLCERHGWRTDRAGVEYDVEQQNCARMIAAGYTMFLLADDPSSPNPSYTPPPELKKKVPAVGVKRVAAGVALLVEWLGSGGKAVETHLAETRAAICSICPKNDGGDWKSYFTQPIADKIRLQLEIKNDLQLATTHDEKLTVCSACDCPLKLKVHVPINHILSHTSDEVKAQLDPRCWILKGT